MIPLCSIIMEFRRRIIFTTSILCFSLVVFIYSSYVASGFPDLSKGVNLKEATSNQTRDAFSHRDYNYGNIPEFGSHPLRQLRMLMKNTSYVPEPLQAYIIPYQDAHQNTEFIMSRDRRLKFLSGFTGEDGKIVITEDHAYLWTYRMYSSEATNLDENWILIFEGDSHTGSFESWLAKTLPNGAKIGFDPMVMTYEEYSTLQDTLNESNQKLVSVSTNLVDSIWSERPPMPTNAVIPLELQYTGEMSASKIARLRNKMSSNGAAIHLVTILDEIAWLLNLRGSDIPFVPVFFSYLIITSDEVHLFLNEGNITPAVRQHLQNENTNVVFHPYHSVLTEFVSILSSKLEGKSKIWFTNNTSYGFVSAVSEEQRIFLDSPIEAMKMIKNEAEIKGFINAHIKDAVALCSYFAWIENELANGNSSLTEMSGASKLLEYRMKQENFMGLSFPTISSSGPHAAIIHYEPSIATDRPISTEEIYLCDSGGQYKDGTTDVTRTMHFGTPSEYEKECFTRVLKGFIQLGTSKFPDNTKGSTLDTLARQSLWEVGLEYFHSTGHGIGAFLSVHEGPIDISYSDSVGLQEGMLLSNEPGYYENGQFGIRIENIVRTVVFHPKYVKSYMQRKFLTFDNLTLVPIQTSKLLVRSMLTEKEIQHINEYHSKCREKIAPILKAQGETEGLIWLMKETEPIQ